MEWSCGSGEADRFSEQISGLSRVASAKIRLQEIGGSTSADKACKRLTGEASVPSGTAPGDPSPAQRHATKFKLAPIMPRTKATYRADEEILVKPRNQSEIGFHKHSIHNPHNITGTTIQGRHYQWHIRG